MNAERDSTKTLEQVRDKLRAAGRFVIYQPNTTDALWAEDLADAIDAHLTSRDAVVSFDSGDVVDAVSKAMRRAWSLGQTYWQQADSESWSQNKKADETQYKFIALVDETRAAIESFAASLPVAKQLPPMITLHEAPDSIEDVHPLEAFARGWNAYRAALLAQGPAGVREGFLPNGTRVMWQANNGKEFPATITDWHPAVYDARLDDGTYANGYGRGRFSKINAALAKRRE